MDAVLQDTITAHRVGDGDSPEDFIDEGTEVFDVVADPLPLGDFYNVEFTYQGERWVAGFEGGSGLWAFGL